MDRDRARSKATSILWDEFERVYQAGVQRGLTVAATGDLTDGRGNAVHPDMGRPGVIGMALDVLEEGLHADGRDADVKQADGDEGRARDIFKPPSSYTPAWAMAEPGTRAHSALLKAGWVQLGIVDGWANMVLGADASTRGPS